MTLRYGNNGYTLKRGTMFALGCYGPNKHEPNLLWPSVIVIRGTGTVDTIAATPGGLRTFQALVSPVNKVTQRITVHEGGRSPTDGVMSMQSTGPVVDVTPEIPIVDSDPALGPGNGHCIYPHGMRAAFHFDHRQQSVVMKVTVMG